MMGIISYKLYHIDPIIWTMSYGPYRMDHIIWCIFWSEVEYENVEISFGSF